MPARQRFTDVPTWQGKPVLACEGDPVFSFYVDWLADYLYRPTEPSEPASEAEVARVFVRTVDRAVAAVRAEWLGERVPAYRYPANGASHGDIPFRRELSRVLSRMPDKAQRVRQLRWWYETYEFDCMK